MGDHRLSRRHRRAPRPCRAISRQAIPEQTAQHFRHELRGHAVTTKLREVDVVIVGLGWTGGILAKELTEAGMKGVALERGAPRTTGNDYLLPKIRGELPYVVRHDLMQNTARDTITVGNSPQQ